MTLKPKALLTIAAFSLTTALVAHATPAGAAALTWNLQAQFSDGGNAQGTFDYDATSGIFSQFNIATNPGTLTASLFPALTYTSSSSTIPLASATGLKLDNHTAGRDFLALFSAPLTNAGGIFSLVPLFSRERIPLSGGVNLSRDVQSGFVSTSATAIPTPALLPGLIGLGMGVLRQKRKQAKANA